MICTKVVRLSDGLGNQMFQYAFARALKECGYGDVYLDSRFINNEDMKGSSRWKTWFKRCDIRNYELDKFHISIPIASDSVLKRFDADNNLLSSIRCAVYDEAQTYDVHILNKKKWKNVYYKGYFFDLIYYDKIRPILQREFCLANPVKLPHRVWEILQKENTVSIHIRRGDFLKFGRNISESDYYKRAISYIKAHVEDPFFIVFSDDISWVRKNMSFPDHVLYADVLGLADYEELMLMKHCKHNIIANSTFSYWAAWLNSNKNKIVISPRRWHKGDAQCEKIIPDEWIKL